MNREAEMSAPLIEYWSGRGYTVYCEVPFFENSIDMVAISDERVVVIEMKMSFTKHLLKQIESSGYHTHAAYGAVSSNPRASSIAAVRKCGFGLLRVYNSSVEMICESVAKELPREWILDHIRANAELQEPGGVAGLPNLKGEGPARAVAREVIEYRSHHPNATWLDLFETIPNHYASMQSMRCALTSRRLV